MTASASDIDWPASLGLLSSAAIADALDGTGLRDQVMRGGLLSLHADQKIAGHAKTLKVKAVESPPSKPYAVLLSALDSCERGDVLVVSGASGRSAIIGGLVATAALASGVVGAVIEGAIRDSAELAALDFPTFFQSRSPADSFGRDEVVAFDVDIECCGVGVVPGDLVFADIDGVVVVPRAVERQVFDRAVDKLRSESDVRLALQSGRAVSEVFGEYGVL